jgi:hypothetical protein
MQNTLYDLHVLYNLYLFKVEFFRIIHSKFYLAEFKFHILSKVKFKLNQTKNYFI